MFSTEMLFQCTKTGSRFSAQQFIHPNVQISSFPRACLYTMVDEWAGVYRYRSYGETISRGQEIEVAVMKEDN